MSTDTIPAPEMPGADTPSTEIARRIHQEQVQVMPLMSDSQIASTWRLATAYARSGIYKDIRQAEEAFAKLLVGRDLGLSPARAMSSVQFVEGAIQIHYRTLLGWVRERGLQYKFPQEEGRENPDNERAIIDFYGEKDPDTGEREFLGRSRFSQEDAATAGLDRPTRSGKPSNYLKYPRNMLVARATSNGIGWFCPEVLNGVPVYVEGEIPQPELTITAGDDTSTAAPTLLPEPLAQLVARAQAVDSTAWRRNEVLARLPKTDDPTYVPTVDGIVAEITRWLEEREPVDAEVVPDGESLEQAEAEDGPRELKAELQHRWDADETWRQQVEILLVRRDELDESLAAEQDDGTVGQIQDELHVISEKLDALDVPIGWAPAESGSEA